VLERDPKTYDVIGAAMRVHQVLGCGFLEEVYQDALALELKARRIPFEREVLLPVHYMGERVGKGYKVDFRCHGDVIVELKAQAQLDSTAIARTLNYVRCAGQAYGLLFNFGATSLEFRRLVVKGQEIPAIPPGGG
jgi:GxxExxY protein